MEYSFMLAMIDALLLVGACVTFIMPLRRREKWWHWLPVGCLLLVVNMVLGCHSRDTMVFVYDLITYLIVVFLVKWTTELSVADGCYCAVWILISAIAVEEIWLGLRLPQGAVMVLDLRSGAELAAFAAVMFLILSRTVARWMPQGDLYQVGPGQLAYGMVLGGMFVALSHVFLLPQISTMGAKLLIALCQMCCVILLVLQTEIVKRRHAEKRLDILNLLCGFGAQQYAISQQHVAAVRQKCDELEYRCRQMEQYLPPEFCQAAKTDIEEARKACDTVVKTGSNVLDIVLTEKKLLAEANQTQLSCVADGKLLQFMEVVDVYALFTYALEVALEAVGAFSDEEHRLVDLLVYEAQNFLVINLIHPIHETTYKRKSRLNTCKIMVIRRIVEKYHGVHAVERHDGFFDLKLLIPLAQNRK